MIYQKSVWNGYDCLNFLFYGRDAKLVCPTTPTKNKNWVLKTEYFDAFPTVELSMLQKGYHVAFISNINRWGLQEDLDIKLRFRDFLVKEFSLSPRCIPIGMSCGGLFAIKLAAKYPKMVSVVYLDAPVVNLLSLMRMGEAGACQIDFEQEILNALSLTRSSIISYRDHPLDHIPTLIREKIPVCLVYGNSDNVVPHHENADIIQQFYRKTDIPFLSFEKDRVGHHPHGLEKLSTEQSQAVLRFLLDNDR